jgi:hypothetical protein
MLDLLVAKDRWDSPSTRWTRRSRRPSKQHKSASTPIADANQDVGSSGERRTRTASTSIFSRGATSPIRRTERRQDPPPRTEPRPRG